ncbi:acyl carrier protein [Micromonospora sp. NPDC007271]|uniref:acyl carrier protein n=1 Tax=Micromonospora sp. NPDC007271 TaxID=3154587 RepID=UPI00340EC81D
MIDEIRQSIVEALGQMNYDVDDVSGDTVLGPAGLDLESLAVAELAVRIEDTFGTRFSDSELEKFGSMTLNEFAAEVAARMAPATTTATPQ